MPSNDTSNEWAVRVTLPHEVFRRKVLESRWGDCLRFVCVLHVGSRTQVEHAHFLMTLNKELQRQSITERFKKWLTGGRGGNKYLQVSKWDGDMKAFQYLFAQRSKPDLIAVEGFTQEVIEECRSRAAAQDAEFEASSSGNVAAPSPRKASKKATDVTQVQLINMLAETYRAYDEIVTADNDLYGRLVNDAIDLMNKYEKPFCSYSLQRIIDTAMCKRHGALRSTFVAGMVSSYMKKLNAAY